MVQEAAVALISAAAEACQDEDFGRYYDAVMPFLMQVRPCVMMSYVRTKFEKGV